MSFTPPAACIVGEFWHLGFIKLSPDTARYCIMAAEETQDTLAEFGQSLVKVDDTLRWTVQRCRSTAPLPEVVSAAELQGRWETRRGEQAWSIDRYCR